MTPTRLACVRYLNTLPLIEGLSKLRGCELIPTVPSRIADMVRAGEADLGLVSLVDAARHGDLALIPAGMIGCDGPTLTVRLFSTVALDRVSTLHADTDSHTSVVLCQLLLRHLFGRSVSVIDFDARERVAHGQPMAATSLDEAWPETVLLIGDKVVTDAPPHERYPHQLDLGEAWKKLTGLPFVYAMWMCRQERAEEEAVQHAAAMLARQLRHNKTRMDWIVSARADEHRWPMDLAQRYLCSLLRYSVGTREREAVERFTSMASEAGLVPAWKPHWVKLRRPAHVA